MSEDRSSQVKSTDDRRSSADNPPPGETPGEDASGGADEQLRSTQPPQSGLPVQDSQKTVISKRPPVSPPAFRRAANPFEMGEALEGEQLGHFQLEQFVGGGGMGAVFRATDTMLGRTVAVKVVAHDQTNEDALRRFKNEAQSAARLDHPNIARVYYVGVDKGWNYIVFEYIEGINVRDLVDHHGPLSLEDAISYTLQIAEALEHASQRDVTHRDIKPSNILIMADGRAKLVDMGLARLQHVESSTEDLTASGVTLGTFDYISPEQARDPRNTDVRSDLYSLGCTLFFMLTGQPPFPDGTVLQKLLSHSGDNPPDLREYRPDIDEEVAKVLDRLLAKQPDQRYQSPRELIGALLLIVERLDLAGIRAQSTVWYTHSEQKAAWWARHVPWVVAVVSLLLIVLAFGWFESDGGTQLGTVPILPASPTATESNGSSQPMKMVGSGEAGSSGATEDSGEGAKPASPDGMTKSQPEITTTDEDAQDDSSGGEAELSPKTDRASADTTDDNSTNEATEPPKTGDLPDNGTRELAKSDPQTTGDETAATSNTRTALIVVTERPVGDDSDIIYVTSLEEAIEQAMDVELPTEIEIQIDGLQLLDPLVIDTDRLAESRLTIRAARGVSPVFAFRPKAGPRGGDAAQAMIDIIGGHVSWHGIDFYLEMPESAQPADCRSLLRLDSTERTDFRECTFTIRNVGLEGTADRYEVAFIDVVGPGGITGLLFESRPLGGDAPMIMLRDCIARGQAPFARADFAVPFRLSWEHGLFVSSDRLVEVGGTNFEPRWEHGVVNVDLQSLLCVADEGICLVRSDYVTQYHLGVIVKCDDCLFATKAVTPQKPLYVVRSGSGFAPTGHPLKIRGSQNYYKNTQVVLRIESAGDRNAIEQFEFDDLTTADPPAWFSEEDPEPALDSIFSWDAPEVSVDRQTTHDFVPPSIGDGWFTDALALAPSQLPRLPDIPKLLEQARSTDAATDASEESPFRLLYPETGSLPK